jgi:hypothetical protein
MIIIVPVDFRLSPFSGVKMKEWCDRVKPGILEVLGQRSEGGQPANVQMVA